MDKQIPHPSPKQTGAVLVISLLMLLVMTLIGVTAMSTATLEEKMAANSQYTNMSFQASESAVEGVVNNIDLIQQALNAGVGNPISRNVDLDNSHVASTGELEFRVQGPAPGYSAGEDQGSFTAFHFIARGIGTMPAVNARTDTSQGVYRIAPGGG